MIRGTRRIFPQLYDENWVRSRIERTSPDLGARAIARELACSLQSSEKALRRFHIFIRRPWSSVEFRALDLFYPQHQACLLALAFNRSNWSIWRCASRRRITSRKPPHARAPSSEESQVFWNQWQRFILEAMLVHHLEQEVIFGLTWRPARASDCDACELRTFCPRDGRILPCERKTVLDYLTEAT